jgi:hypothetical protein
MISRGTVINRVPYLNLQNDIWRECRAAWVGPKVGNGGVLHDVFAAEGSHGTLTNMAPTTAWGWNDELKHFTLSFDGSDDNVTLSNSFHRGLGDETFSCWARLPSGTSGSRSICKDGGVNYYIARWAANNLYFYGRNGTPSSGAFSLGVWHHVALIVRGSTQEVWIDGDMKDSDATSAFAVSSNTFYIGSEAANFWNGDIAVPVMWGRALTLHEIARLANKADPSIKGAIRY